jgi:hypothetical protein
MAKKRMAGEKLRDSTPNEHEVTGMRNFNNKDYATNNQYGRDLSGITYKAGISEHFGGDGSIGANDIKRMMDAGYSSDDVYNFSKKKGLNYNQHGQKYMKGQGDYKIGKGSDQWGDIFGYKDKGEDTATNTPTPSASNNGTASGDNSINSPISQANPQTVSGNNNQVSQDNSITQTVDNSVDNSDNSRRFYGGSTRTFNYKGGDGESKLYDTPVSSATMGGYYDVDDSPAASQKFMDMYIDSNRLAQRGNRREYNTYKNTDYSPNNSERDSELNSELKNSIQESRDRADKGRDAIFKGKSPFDFNFTLPEMPTPITSDASKIYEDTLNKIK